MSNGSLRQVDLDRYRRTRMQPFSVRTEAGCRRFVDAMGFCYAFTAGPGGIPGLFDVIGTRSTNRMWSWAWQWKEHLATTRRLFYGRIVRRKPTFISLGLLPHFYALTGNAGDPDDYEAAYEAGQLSLRARDLYEHLARHGPLNTWALRRRFVSQAESGARLHRALGELQERFLVAKVGEVEGRGSYAFIWNTFERWMPDVIDKARVITSGEGAAAVLRAYLRMVGAATAREVADVFRWPPALLAEGSTRAGVTLALLDEESCWTLPGLLPVSGRSARRPPAARRR